MGYFAIPKARRSTPLYDVIVFDVVDGATNTTVLINHQLRVPRFAANLEIVVLMVAEITRVELTNLRSYAPGSTDVKTIVLSSAQRAARPDRDMGARFVRRLREAGEA